MNFRRHIDPVPMQMQLAPFIDVVMFLLAFFLLTWHIARDEADLDVNLPVADNAQPQENLPGEIVVNIREDGTVVMNKKEIDLLALRAKLAEIVQLRADQAVILRADENTDYKHVVNVLDACRGADLWNIAFATKKADEASPPTP